tara:strand:+ start:525 stop:1934 length:1410 start_codon:yes stop_codon:yes gene_type:complete
MADEEIPPPGDSESAVAAAPSAPVINDPELDALFDAIRDRDVSEIGHWVSNHAQTTAFWIDIGLIGLSLLLALGLHSLFRNGKLPAVERLLSRIPTKRSLNVFSIKLLLSTWFLVCLAGAMSLSCPFLRIYALIVSSYVFINLPSRFLKWKSWMSLFTTGLFIIITLHFLGLLDNTTAVLESISLNFGSLDISILDIIQGVLAFILFFWLAGFSSTIIAKRLSKVQDLSPNVRVLFSKAIRVGLFIIAAFVSLGVMGIKVTTLAVFGGALGLGLGFGLQKVISNLVSGVILLLDRSVKPGDVIEIGQTYGWINSLNLRYVSVVTRDQKEHLIPNEDLITNPVINWSFSSNLVRVRAPFGISYSSDIRKAMELATESANTTERVIEDPAPRCNLVGFGDSAVDLELRFWINDPHNGIGQVRSDVLLKIWDAFHQNNIDFPFPQRDVNLKLSSNTDLTDILDSTQDKKDTN